VISIGLTIDEGWHCLQRSQYRISLMLP
jgi:hypothetical protein